MKDYTVSDNLEIEEEMSASAFSNLFDTVADMLKLIKQHIFIFILTIAVLSAGAFAYSWRSYCPMYKATATFSITPLVMGNATNGVSVYQFNYTSSFADQLAATFPYIVQSSNLRDVIKSDLGGYINGNIEAAAVTSTNVFQVTVKSGTAADTVKILDSFINNFPKISDYIIGDTRLNMIYRSGEPTKPYNSPDHLRHTSYGFFCGLLINLVIFFIMALNRETLRDKNDVRVKLNSACLCEIPVVSERKGGKSKNEIIRIGTKRPVFSEAVRFLKKRTLSAIDGPDKIIGVTSALKGEGKTTVAFNLALSLATGGSNILLIDLNASKPELQRLLLKNPDIKNGVTDFCRGKVDMSDMLYNFKPNFDIIFGGTPANKLDGERLSRLLRAFREEYDYIIIDMPSCVEAAEVSMISDMCDDIMFVLKCDTTSVSEIKNAFRHVLYSKSRFIGFVINESTLGSSGYYGGKASYGYHGRYYGRYGKRYYSHYKANS